MTIAKIVKNDRMNFLNVTILSILLCQAFFIFSVKKRSDFVQKIAFYIKNELKILLCITWNINFNKNSRFFFDILKYYTIRSLFFYKTDFTESKKYRLTFLSSFIFWLNLR